MRSYWQVLERIQQQMAEVMASAQEAANSAVSNENEARAMQQAKPGSDNEQRKTPST